MSTDDAAETPADDSNLDQFLHSQDADPSALSGLHTAAGHTGSELIRDQKQEQRKRFWKIMAGTLIVVLLVVAGIVWQLLTPAPPTPPTAP